DFAIPNIPPRTGGGDMSLQSSLSCKSLARPRFIQASLRRSKRCVMYAHVLAVAVAMASPLVEGRMVDVVARLAGKEATACGIVRLKQDSVEPLVCASRNLLSKNAFWVAVQIQGEDSFLWRAAAQS